jgi:hypothetical protein
MAILSTTFPVRPVSDAGERITPLELALYHAPGFHRPCCLCAVPRVDGSSPGYTESTVVMVVNGDRSGEYVVTCATARCGYQGKCSRLPMSHHSCMRCSVSGERVWSAGPPSKAIWESVTRQFAAPALFQQCAHSLHNAPCKTKAICEVEEAEDVEFHQRNCRYVCMHLTSRCSHDGSQTAGIRSGTPSASESPFMKLMRLDTHPGLPQSDFRHLFIRCHQCRWIMTRAAFGDHICPRAGLQEVIDLTLDDSDAEQPLVGME